MWNSQENRTPKTECLHKHQPATFSQANVIIGCYIHFTIIMHSVKNRRGTACAIPYWLKFNIFINIFCAVHTNWSSFIAKGKKLRRAYCCSCGQQIKTQYKFMPNIILAEKVKKIFYSAQTLTIDTVRSLCSPMSKRK